MMETTEIVEAATATHLTGRKYRVRLIEGDRLGTSGYYPAEMLRRDGPKVFKAGLPMYLDHQTPDEKEHKPFGSVTNFAGVLASDAVYENDGLYADVEVFEHQIPLIRSLKDHIGVSIRAKGYTAQADINGKTVPVFQELIEAKSADFVVKAGAGGQIVSILESAQREEGNMDEVLKEMKELRESIPAMISTAIEAALPKEEPVVASSEEQAPEAVVDYDRVVEIAEALAASNLSKAGRARVLELHRTGDKDIAELIAAEEAYVTEAAGDREEAGAEESAHEESKKVVETEESLKLPGRWTKK